MFDADSPQGKMIVNAPKQPFSADSTALLQTISADVGVIKNSVGVLVSMAQTDARGDALSSADVPHNVQDEAELAAVGLGGGAAGGGAGGGGGGFFSKLFGGAGGIMAGAGLLVGGFGALLAGGGVLLKEFNNFDGEKFKKNIESIMSIVPSITSPGAALAFAADTGLFLVTMGTLGAGMALFGIGSALGTALESGLANFINPEWAQSIKDNVTILLSIGDMFGEGWKGQAAFIGTSATFLAAMTTIGSGLAIFGLGSAVAGIGDGLNQGINHFTTKNWATSIKDNVATLLGINDLFEGGLDALKKSGTFLVAMTTIGAGLAVFGAGSVVAGAADAVTSGIDKFGEIGWAQSIVDNVTTLLGINNLFDGFKDVLIEGGTFVVAMGAITAGLALFSFGAIVAGTTTNALDVTDWIARGEGMTWSQSIVDHVTTLLSIASLPNVTADTAQFALTMGGISAGLLAFGVGSFFATGADTLSHWISQTTEGEGTWSDKIKARVMTLLSIIDPEKSGVTVQDAENFSLVMGKLSFGLGKFAGGTFVSSILNAGSAAWQFLTGTESPVQEMQNLADKADDLEAGATALDKLEKSLNKISNLKFDGKSLKLKEFGQDLMQSLPYIENAIMGSRGQDLSWWPLYKGAQFEGLASPTIDYAGASANFKRLQEMGINTQVMPAMSGATQNLRDVGSEMHAGAGSVTIINANDNSSNSSSSDQHNYREMDIDHNEQTGHWWSRNSDLAPY